MIKASTKHKAIYDFTTKYCRISSVYNCHCVTNRLHCLNTINYTISKCCRLPVFSCRLNKPKNGITNLEMRNGKIENSSTVLIFLSEKSQMSFGLVMFGSTHFFIFNEIGAWALCAHTNCLSIFMRCQKYTLLENAENIEYRQHGADGRNVAFTTVIIAGLWFTSYSSHVVASLDNMIHDD